MPSSIEVSQTAVIVPAAQANAADDDQLIEIWLHGRSAHTIRAYRADIERFRLRAGKPLARVTLSDLQQFALTLEELAPATRYRTLSALKSLLAFGHRIGYLPFDVGRVLRLPAVRNRLAERILPEADLHRILSLEPNARNRAMLTLLYASGIRVSGGGFWHRRDRAAPKLAPQSDGRSASIGRTGEIRSSGMKHYWLNMLYYART